MADIKFLELLAKDYPNTRAASEEIINLSAILALPKGTEYFLSDLHGEHEAFIHMLRSASGSIKTKVDKNSASSARRTARFGCLILIRSRNKKKKKKSEPDFDKWVRRS